MSSNPHLPAVIPPSDFDRMVGSIFAYIEDGIPERALFDLTFIAETAEEFEAGMGALVELGDIINDHYDKTEREPDDGPYDEIEDSIWGTEGDDFDPDEDWFQDGGPFGPYDDGDDF